MAALVEGQQYGLSAQDKINCNKSLIFVKLTDSALRSIEEYLRNKGNNLSKPTIEFQNNNGVIHLPVNSGSQTYGFTLSNVETDGPQGSFECLRQTGHRSLESLGCMHMKMHIHANEDSYEKTRVKMAAAEQEHKKFCTKEIKPNGTQFGRKVKVKRPGLVVSPKISSPPSSSLIPKNPIKVLNGLSLNNNSLSKKSDVQKFQNTSVKKNKVSNTELMRQPIRDRIIHILAVKPYKRPELLVRLMNEGIREKDKGISAVLSQVGSLKGNVYYLSNHLWNEVQDNWKFYSQEEAELVRKKKQQILSANNENEVPSPNNHPSTSPLQKRGVNEITSSSHEPRIKKQRISHYNRSDNASHNIKNESVEFSASDKNQLPAAAICKKTSYSHNAVQPNLNRCSQENSSQKFPNDISNCNYSNGYKNSESFVGSELQVPPPTESPSQFNCPDYLKEYGTIESRDQRARYKADFNAQYEEYLHLHSKIKDISKRFAYLENHLHNCEEGSEEFKRVKSKIYKEYRTYQQDPSYVEALKKFNFLHCKLSHIKKLVMEYDNAQYVKS